MTNRVPHAPAKPQRPMTDDHGPEIAHNQDEVDVHFRLGQLTRQLHDSLNALGIADKLHGAAEELPTPRAD